MNKGFKAMGTQKDCSSLSRKEEKANRKSRKAKERRNNKNSCRDY